MDVAGLNELEGYVVRFTDTLIKSRLMIQDYISPVITSLIFRVIKNFKDELKLDMMHMDHDLKILEEIR